MFKNLFNGMLSAFAIKLLENYRHLSIQLLKIEVAKAYLHGVKTARSSAIGLLCLGLLIGLICVGVMLFHIGLFILLPWSMESKAILGMVLGLIYITTGVIVLRAAMDEKTWMKRSGATQMIKEAMGQSKDY